MPPSARTRAELTFAGRLGRPPEGLAFAPGRLVLLGEHLDHQGGRVIAAPLRQGVHVAWGVRPDTTIRLLALDARGVDRFDARAPGRADRRWAALARGVVEALVAHGVRVPGLDLVACGDLPAARGQASSAAWQVALLRALLAATERTLETREAAALVAGVERRRTGVPCGPLDPHVAWVGQPDELVVLDCGAGEHMTRPRPAGARLRAVDTGIARRLDQTPYATRRRELDEATATWTGEHGERPTWVAIEPAVFEAGAAALPEAPRRRARHVVGEAARVREALAALDRDDLEALGALLDASHRSLRDDFDASLPPIDAQVARVRAEAGVLGARLQGAGWGGTIVALETG